MKKNYISTRIASAAGNVVNHNFSSSEEERSRSQIKEKQGLKENYFFDRDSKTMKVLTTKTAKQIRPGLHFLKAEADRKFKQDYKNRRKENLKKDIGILEGVFTFSESIDDDLGKKYSLNDLGKAAQDATDEICKYLGTKQVGPVVAHDDETRLHFHYHMENFDSSRDGYSLKYKYRKKEHLSKIQDIAFKHFSKLGMERGKKKELTSANYEKQSKWHEKQLEKKGNEMNEILNDYINIFESIIDEENPSKLELLKSEIMENKKKNKETFTPLEIKISNLMMRTITQKEKGNDIEKNIKKFNIQKNELHIENEKLKDNFNEIIDEKSNLLGNIDADFVKEQVGEIINNFEGSISKEITTLKQKQLYTQKTMEVYQSQIMELEDTKPIKKENEILKTEIKQIKKTLSQETNNFVNYKAIQEKKDERAAFVKSIKLIDPRTVFNFDFGKSNNDNFFNCYSPLRDDGKHPAMTWKFYENGWKFKDHGTDESGDLIDFLKLSQDKSFNEIIDYLNNSPIKYTSINKQEQEKINFKYERSEIYFTPLKNYLKDRKIEKIPSWLDQYKFKNKNGKNYYSLGIKNTAGGINIRNPRMKGCRGSNGYSHLINNENNKSLIITEGLFDALHINQKLNSLNPANFVSLNSIENTKSFLNNFDFKDYENVFIMLDNDDQALDKIIEIEDHLKTLPIKYKTLFSNNKDFAEDCEKNQYTLDFIDFSFPSLDEFKRKQALQIVNENGLLLKDLSPKLQADKEIVLTAAKQNKNSIIYADKSIRNEVIVKLFPKEEIESPKPKPKKKEQDFSQMRMR